MSILSTNKKRADEIINEIETSYYRHTASVKTHSILSYVLSDIEKLELENEQLKLKIIDLEDDIRFYSRGF